MMSWTKKLKTYRINKGLVAFEAVVTFDRRLLVVSYDIVSINIYIFMMIKPLNKWLQVLFPNGSRFGRQFPSIDSRINKLEFLSTMLYQI